MGYYTQFRLTTYPPLTADEFRIASALEGNGSFEYCLTGGQSAKWYDYEKCMVEISTHFPETLFVLHGEGEEGGDLWTAYYLNGQVREDKALITYPDPPEWAKERM